MSLATLVDVPRWVAWQTEGRGPQGKLTKVPYAPDGRKARADAPTTWGTRAAAEARAGQLHRPCGDGGVGLELGVLDGLAIGGVDLDTCRDKVTGEMAPWAAEVVSLLRSYVEVSPSGTGAKVFFLYDPADLPTLRTLMGTEWGKQFKRRTGDDHPPAIEIYLGNRYFAVTGDILPDAPPALRMVPTTSLERLLQHIGPAFAIGAAAGQGEARARPGPAEKPAASAAIPKAGDGSRSALAFKVAAGLKRDGGTYDDFLATLKTFPAGAKWMQEKGEADGGRELRRCWDRAGQAVEDDVLLTEHGVALAFTKAHFNRLRYCHDTGGWYEWTGTHWRRDRKHAAFSFARALIAQANKETELKTQAITGKASFAAGVERMAKSDPALATTADEWDRDPFLLATPGGTVDLRTGVLRLARPGDMMTRLAAVAPAELDDPLAQCPTWRRFLIDATRNDFALIGFLKRFCGYCLTGDTREHALLFGYGPGGNGKSVFANTVAGILGDYATVASMETFSASMSDRHPTDLAMLRGARLVTSSETEEGRAWAESRIKQMTGGDPISARFMRQDFFTFHPAFKLFIVGNHKPALRNVDEAARRRFNIVPFLYKPENPDRELEAKLRAEWSGILRWMIEGCLAWQADGLMRPPVVTAATEEYFDAQDHFGRWLAECCDLVPDASTRPSTLRAAFAHWCEQNGEQTPDSKQFRSIIERTGGLRYVMAKGLQYVRGIRLLTEQEARKRSQEAAASEGQG